jgi:hypothetical protein
MRPHDNLRIPLLAALLWLAGGCTQLSVDVRLREDGGAEVREELRVARRLLEQEAGLPGGKRYRDMLTQQAAARRAEFMGKGVKLTSFQAQDTLDGGLQAVAVYTIPDINNLRILAPFFGLAGHQDSYLKMEVGPSYGTRWASPDMPGWMYVHFSMVADAGAPNRRTPASAPAGRRGPAKPLDAPDAATPADLQALRELEPVLKETLQDCRLKITFEAYNPLWAGSAQYPGVVHKRGTSEPTNVYTLIDVSGENLDLVGRSVLENEEVMLDLLKGRPEGPSLNGLVLSTSDKGYTLNSRHDPRLPFYYVRGLNWTSERLRFAPSEFHVKKFFDGKLVSQGGSVKE